MPQPRDSLDAFIALLVDDVVREIVEEEAAAASRKAQDEGTSRCADE